MVRRKRTKLPPRDALGRFTKKKKPARRKGSRSRTPAPRDVRPVSKALTAARKLGIEDAGPVRVGKSRTQPGKRGVRAIGKRLDKILSDMARLEKQGKRPLVTVNIKARLADGETGEVRGIVLPLPSDVKGLENAKGVARRQVIGALFSEFHALRGDAGSYVEAEGDTFEAEFMVDTTVPQRGQRGKKSKRGVRAKRKTRAKRARR